jgi:hypothetical protein
MQVVQLIYLHGPHRKHSSSAGVLCLLIESLRKHNSSVVLNHFLANGVVQASIPLSLPSNGHDIIFL